MVQNIIVFDVGTHHFALDANAVLAIIRAVEVTTLPDMPPPFMGVINYRGAVLPVVHLSILMGVASSVTSVHQHMIIATTSDQAASFCFVVDQVTGFAIPDAIQAIGPLSDEHQTVQRISELVRIGTAMIPLLRLDALIGRNSESLPPFALFHDQPVATQD